nr:Tail fiber assembly protein [Salmonella sp. NCTC 7297]
MEEGGVMYGAVRIFGREATEKRKILSLMVTDDKKVQLDEWKKYRVLVNRGRHQILTGLKCQQTSNNLF